IAILNVLLTNYLTYKRFIGNFFVRAVKGCVMSSLATVFFVFVYSAVRTWPKPLFLPLSAAKILVVVLSTAIVMQFLISLFFICLLEGTKKVEMLLQNSGRFRLK
ncbi:MAG: hypothetical protein AB1652_11640, partial [Bacillota bacterium]